MSPRFQFWMAVVCAVAFAVAAAAQLLASDRSWWRFALWVVLCISWTVQAVAAWSRLRQQSGNAPQAHADVHESD